jgi:outer membrane immunogenic protein
VRGRLGWAAGPWLTYVTGGWAYGKVSGSGAVTIAGVTTAFSGSETRTDGWTVGAGVEYKFAQNWSFGVEYLYLNFGGDTTTAATPAGVLTLTTSDIEDHIVRARLNFHF